MIGKIISCSLIVLMVSGCETTRSVPDSVINNSPRFYAESESNGLIVKLPISQIAINVESKPILTEWDLMSVELRDGIGGKILVFMLRDFSAYDLFGLSVQYLNKRLVCSMCDDIIGMTILNDAISDGVLIVYPEKSDDELIDIVIKMNKAITYVNKVRKNR